MKLFQRKLRKKLRGFFVWKDRFKMKGSTAGDFEYIQKLRSKRCEVLVCVG